MVLNIRQRHNFHLFVSAVCNLEKGPKAWYWGRVGPKKHSQPWLPQTKKNNLNIKQYWALPMCNQSAQVLHGGFFSTIELVGLSHWQACIEITNRANTARKKQFKLTNKWLFFKCVMQRKKCQWNGNRHCLSLFFQQQDHWYGGVAVVAAAALNLNTIHSCTWPHRSEVVLGSVLIHHHCWWGSVEPTSTRLVSLSSLAQGWQWRLSVTHIPRWLTTHAH